MTAWLDQVRALTVADVAGLAGLRLVGRAVSPCPGCGAESRGGGDRRGPVGLTPDGRGWRCFRCGTSGDVVALVAWGATGTLKPASWTPVSEWAEARGLLAPAGVPQRPLEAAPAPEREVAAPSRPPGAAQLWGACRPVTDDAGVAEWLRCHRGIDPVCVEDLDVARALPAAGPLPSWARCGGGDWRERGFRLILPCFDGSGALVSLRARHVLREAASAKEAAPVGATATGAVLADGLGRALLEGDELARDLALRLGVLVAEGAPDFLSCCAGPSDAAELPAVFGLFSGGWTTEIANRIPDGAAVRVATHGDKAGDAYARQVAATLRGRCRVSRVVLPSGRDLNDLLRGAA